MIAGPRPLFEFLDESVAKRGDEVVLRVDDAEWTYRQFGGLVDQCAAHLTAAGVRAGSRIGLSAGNSAEFIAVVFAAFRLGAVVVTISTAWRDGEVAHALDLTDPTHLVTDGSGAADLASLAASRILITVEELRRTPAVPVASATRAPVDLDDVAVMVFSSGTTGLPKAVRHSHRTMSHAMAHWIETLGLTADDRLQIATPPFHILGLLNLLVVVATGASVRLHRRFDLDTVLGAIERDRVTIEMAVAPIALAMAAHPELEGFDLSSLRYIMWGATPVTPSVAETVTRRSGVPFLPAYGASELPVLSGNPVDRPAEWRLDSAGLPPTGVELRVVDLESGEVVGPGVVGEIQGRSPSLMVGYLPASATAEVIVDGWYRTGDVGTLDADGWVTITDRVKEMIKVNGFQVAPAEIEAELLGHPAVADCAVFGVPDARTGEAVVAAVVLTAFATTSTPDPPSTPTSASSVTAASAIAEELRALVATRLAAYKRVREVVVVSRIPRLPSGKVLRRELRAAHPPAGSHD